MKNVFWAILVLGVCAFFVYTSITARNQRLALEQVDIAETKSIRNAVLGMVHRNGAIDNWDTQLSGGDTDQFGPIMTVDLERLWLQDKPIMFSGTIKDIKTLDSQNYTVTIDRNILATITIFGPELRLELKAGKQVIDDFIGRWPAVKDSMGYGNGVAVIAKIASIRSDTILREDNSPDHIAIGEGLLLDLAYVGHVSF